MSSNDSRFRISLVQLIASALAAVTAAVVGSFLGVNGTVIGAAIASVLSVLGTAIYSHSLHRTRDRVRSKVPASARWLPDLAPTAPLSSRAPGPTGPARPWPVTPAPAQRRLHPVARVAAAAVIVFAAALGVLTGVEVVAGHPISGLLNGTSASGTTVFGAQGHATTSTTPTTPAVTVTVTPSVVVTTPTVTQTAPPVTVTTSPTATPSGSSTSTNTPTPTGTPTNTSVP